ncbi:hypothetical protein JKP88DRAFT_217816 [Tribonema minus]|uniref:threonine--tRNA ligase n=1 Tax=Tribonema minus TaxID=303371 RepID=A0A835ZFX3_9STRA|nr:hypothetical protein JKP88DRAFT_217816 [Tribonema minus]
MTVLPRHSAAVYAMACLALAGRRATAFRVSATAARRLSQVSHARPLAAFSQATVARRPHHHQSRWVSSQRLSMNSAAAPAIAEEVVPIELPTNKNSENLLKIRHTTAHVMAMAVQKLFPETQVTIGPWIDSGFYYDFFNADKQFSEDDLKAIKKEMDRIIKSKLPLRREEVSREEARRRIEAIGEKFKLEILDSIKTEPITIYHIGEEWWDLCAGPHVETTGDLPPKAIQLQNVAGAYWRGDEKREMLQRIYGTAWESPEQLKEHKRLMEEAKRRDHRVLGKKLDLYSLQEEAGGGLVFWHPKGAIIRRLIEDYWKSVHLEEGYELLYTPHVANLNLWKTSGHFDFYREGMFDQMDVEGEQFQIKPMNCPFHCLVYKDAMRSYRDLPIRWAELGTVYRYERSGTLHGLMRVRGFTQDDAHVFCLPDQLETEIIAILDLFERVLSRFGFVKYEVMLSTRPAKSVGSDEIWELSTASLKGALEKKGWAYEVDEEGGAFYGPKIDLKIKDAIGRLWQCSTVQCDFNLPNRFGLEYTSTDGTKQQPVMLHRAIFGSVERFFGILVENTAGDFPFWLAPTQVKLLPVTDAQVEFAKATAAVLRKAGIRADVDVSNERLAKMIRNAEQQRTPIICVVGEREVEAGALAVRSRRGGDMGVKSVDDLKALLRQANEEAIEPHQVV